MKNKSILVTGGLGFIGSHFVELLYKECSNCTITILDNFCYCVAKRTDDYLFNMFQDSTNKFNIIYEDINNFTDVKDYDYVINFAAESHVDNSIKDGTPFITSNYTGVYNLLTQLKDNQRFIQVGTDEVYGSLQFNSSPSEEYDRLDPSSVYSATKAGADLLALSFNRTYNKDIIITRCTNNFGPRQYPEKLIPVVINKALNNEKIPVYGNGENIRQWIYVTDHCRKLFDVLKYGTSGKIYNIAPDYDSEITNISIVNQILEILKKPKKLITYVEDRKGHDLRYSLRASQYRGMMYANDQQLDLPGTEKTFADDLRYTIMWYSENKNWWRKESNN
jgi:dTDP-glucose 4,6-dehydratase